MLDGSWSLNYDITKSRISSGDVEVISSDEVTAAIALS